MIVTTEGHLLEEDAPRVWKIVSEDPPPAERFTVGVVPDGYEETACPDATASPAGDGDR